jgi:hypothetical protein
MDRACGPCPSRPSLPCPWRDQRRPQGRRRRQRGVTIAPAWGTRRHQPCCIAARMKLWVDDHRAAPRGWRRVRSVAAAKVYLEQGLVTDISLDHDMGACPACTARGRHIGRMTRPGNTFYDYCSHVPSGYDLCLWMEQTGRWPRGSVRVHSANPAGARRMLDVIERSRRASNRHADARSAAARNAWSPGGTGLFRGCTAVLRRVWRQLETVLGRSRTSAKS